MFKEIGAVIDAAGKAAAESLRVSANAVRKALSDEDDNDGRTMGILTPDPKELEDFLNKSGFSIYGMCRKKTFLYQSIGNENRGNCD